MTTEYKTTETKYIEYLTAQAIQAIVDRADPEDMDKVKEEARRFVSSLHPNDLFSTVKLIQWHELEVIYTDDCELKIVEAKD